MQNHDKQEQQLALLTTTNSEHCITQFISLTVWPSSD